MSTPTNKSYMSQRTHNDIISAWRMPNNPIITQQMLAGDDGSNINGPSLIATPDWLPRRLGKFYLYFAHHAGRYIRLAYSDNLEGPWSIFKHGTLQLRDVLSCRDHIASPDVHVDHARHEVRMYFHGVSYYSKDQFSYVAISNDGLSFRPVEVPIGNFYMRVVRWRNTWLGMAKGGVLYRSKEGPFKFDQLHSAFSMSNHYANKAGDVRHVALNCTGDRLEVFFSRIGDKPEHILSAQVDLSLPPDCWRAANSQSVLFPEEEWEGSKLPLAQSKAGASLGLENAVRDPAYFAYQNRSYLLYSTAGEAGIAIAELKR